MAIGMVTRQFQRLFGEGTVSGMDEGELLRRFARQGDPMALEALVNRHGPMVLGVCRRVLGDPHEAEDAFQATFLILARKAGAIRDPDRLGAWLFGVAHRVATRSRANSAKRRSRERPGAEEAAMAEASSGASDFDRDELRRTLDDEVRRLPAKFRDPVILCYLDGLTHDEAATRLSCPVGTVRSRLSTARARLRDRLLRRGVAIPSGIFASVLASETARAAVPPVLLDSTLRAAIAFAAGGAGASALAGASSAAASSLAGDVSRAMMMTKIKILGGLAMAGVLTMGVGGALAQIGAGPATQEKKAEESLDELVARLQKKSEAIALTLRNTERALEKARQENQTLRGRLIEEIARTKVAELNVPPSPKEPRITPANDTMVEAGSTKTELQQAKEEIARLKDQFLRANPASDPFSRPFGPANPPGVPIAGASAARPPGEATDPTRPGGPGAAVGGMSFPGQGGVSAPGEMGGMGGRLGGMSGVPLTGMGATRPKGSISTMASEDYVVVSKPGSRTISAYSTQTGEWSVYEAPEGITMTPIGGSGVVSFMPMGEQVRQLAAFVPQAGRWFTIDLKVPAKGRAVPIISQSLMTSTVDNFVYAFSAPARRWDVLELEDGAKPQAVVSSSRVTVEHGDHLYIFNVRTGTWSDFDAKAGKVVGVKRE